MASNRRTAQCAPEDVFAVLADGWLYGGWVVGASRIRAVDEGWPAPETQIHHSFGVWPLVIDDTTSMLEFDPPWRAVLKARGWPLGTALVTVTAEPTASGCEVTISEDAEEGPGRLVPKIARDPMIKVRNSETLRRLVLLAEGRAH